MANMQITTSYGVNVELEVENEKEGHCWFYKVTVWCDTLHEALYLNDKKNWGRLLDLIEGNLNRYLKKGDPDYVHTITNTSVDTNK